MSRPALARIITSAAALVIISLPILAQSPHKANKISVGAKQAGARTTRSYTPRVKGRSDAFIIEGVIVAISSNRLAVAAADRTHYYFDLDEQTTLFESGELVSVATLADMTLTLSDLRRSDHVEVIAERVEGRSLAKIITRVQTGNRQVAKR